jgi:hypothetical protein
VIRDLRNDRLISIAFYSVGANRGGRKLRSSLLSEVGLFKSNRLVSLPQQSKGMENPASTCQGISNVRTRIIEG